MSYQKRTKYLHNNFQIFLQDTNINQHQKINFYRRQ